MLIYKCSVCRCDELVNGYVVDSDPEARLQVGADMRKIQFCFQLLKVILMIKLHIVWLPHCVCIV